ncbi:MAG: hypothetical protein ACYS7Y_14975 [Planctomycetota bacterium]
MGSLLVLQCGVHIKPETVGLVKNMRLPRRCPVWRSPRTYIVCAALAVCVLPLISLVSRAEEGHGTAPDEHIRAFVKLADEMKITKVEMYYLPWGALTYAPISQESQLTRSPLYQTTIRALEVVPIADDLARKLSTARHKKIRPSKADYRIGCIFYAKNRQVLRVFISENTPAVYINGIPCRVDPAVVDALLPMLPVQAYRNMYKDMLRNWASPGYWRDMVETQQESGDGTK